MVFSLMLAGFSAIQAGGITLAQALPAGKPQPTSAWHRGGAIDVVRAEMRATYASGSCLRGTFMSAATTALEIPGVRVRPDAEFWFHNARRQDWNGNPWNIYRAGTYNIVRGLKPALRTAVLAGVGETTDYRVVYTGAQLAREFGFPTCG